MIGVDWGTTHLRAFRLQGATIIDRMEGGHGILSVPNGGFAAALHAVIAPWLAVGEQRVLMSGMVGSRQGWVEAPYLPCPAHPADLAAATVPVPFAHATVRLVPGLSATDPDGTPEVMRGEEVQIAGVIDRTGADALICLPGSHSKWVRLEGGRVAVFTTHLTGEAFAALRHHTILGRLMQDGPTLPGPFARGVDRSAHRGGLLHHLFGARTLALTGDLPPADAASYLSGLLVGHEVRSEAPRQPVHLVGAAPLCALYAAAIARLGGHAIILDQDAAAAGLARIAEHVAWN